MTNQTGKRNQWGSPVDLKLTNYISDDPVSLNIVCCIRDLYFRHLIHLNLSEYYHSECIAFVGDHKTFNRKCSIIFTLVAEVVPHDNIRCVTTGLIIVSYNNNLDCQDSSEFLPRDQYTFY